MNISPYEWVFHNMHEYMFANYTHVYHIFSGRLSRLFSLVDGFFSKIWLGNLWDIGGSILSIMATWGGHQKFKCLAKCWNSRFSKL